MKEVDPELEQDREIARRLRLTWPAFFDRFGRLTAVQRAAIPPILEGFDVLVVAATASGKTEAACAPLVERNITSSVSWTILYVSPTRALVNDLYERLRDPLARLSLRLTRRTGDHHDKLDGAHVLLTTPESFDSLLCRGRLGPGRGHVLASVVTVVLDEIHLLHGSPRGEQVRWLLERIRRLRNQARLEGWSKSETIQVVGLSATIPDPEAVANAYLRSGEIVRVAGGRMIETTTIASDEPTVEETLLAYIRSLSGPEKILVFSNSRRRVDDLTARLRAELAGLGYEARAHHGNLDVREREGTEAALREAQRIVVFSTSTLELGIDIGDIDLVVLDGPAPDMRAFLQRIGRGNRRTKLTRVMTCAGSVLETIVHSAMVEAGREGWLGEPATGSQLAVARQQVASYVLQAPRRARSRRALVDLLDTCLPELPGTGLLVKMIESGELAEDPSGVRLDGEWLSRAAMGAIHTNIEDLPGIDVVDEESGQRIAKGLSYQSGRGLKAGGLLLEARRWTDRKLEVKRVKDATNVQGEWGYTSRSWLTGTDQPQAVKRYLGLKPHEWPVVEIGLKRYVFHFGGSRLKTVLTILAGFSSQTHGEVVANDWYLLLSDQGLEKPDWLKASDKLGLELAIAANFSSLEHSLRRPRANRHLPDEVRILEVKSWLNVEDVIAGLRTSVWIPSPDAETAELLRMLVDELQTQEGHWRRAK